MQRKMEELYLQYLEEKMNLIFAPKDSQPKFKIIQKNFKYNIADASGKILSEEWFDSVSICNDKLIKVIKNEGTIDVFPMTFKDAIYDENTTYNGRPIKEILIEKKLILPDLPKNMNF